MGRTTFAISLIVNSGLVGFLVTAIGAAYLEEPGEAQEGWGLLWYFSLPAVVLLSLAALSVYARYVALSPRPRLALYCALVATIAAGTPILTLAVLSVMSRAAA